MNFVGDAQAFRLDGIRLTAALYLGADVFHGDDHMTVIGWIECGNDSHRKRGAISTLVGGLGVYSLAPLDMLQDVLDVFPGFFRHELDCWLPNQLGSLVPVDQLRPPVDLQDDGRGHCQVDDEDADGHIFEKVAVALLASQADATRLMRDHAESILSPNRSRWACICKFHGHLNYNE